MSIESGVLYIVSTPIGNLGDLSPRAEAVLGLVDLIAAEDTRHSRPLLHHFGINTPLMAFHEHNERQVMEKLIDRLVQGESIALISDAGTPLISDPGFPLVRECQLKGIKVSPVPGTCALIAALSVSGLPTDRFAFEGFPARTSSARTRQFEALAQESRSLIFYESSHRVLATLGDMVAVFGAQRQAVLARELTKTYETVLNGQLEELLQRLEQEPVQQKGEFVIVIAGAEPQDSDTLSPNAQRTLEILLAELSVKQAAAIAAKITGLKKNRLYEVALNMRRND